jgi:predicted DNA-binding protein (MmcQ/YjbR family)
MTAEALEKAALALPDAELSIPWCMKMTNIAFEALTHADRRPAPDMARAGWVMFDDVSGPAAAEVAAGLSTACRLAAGKLSKTRRAELGGAA